MKLRGIVTVRAWRRGKLLWEITHDNLVVDARLSPIAKLLGGEPTNQHVGVVGFGSGTGQPVAGNTVLTAPAYYKAVGSHSFPVAGRAQFDWSLSGATDTGAVGMNLQEMAIFANTGAVTLPITQAGPDPAPNLTMYARILNAFGVITSPMNFTGTWTLVVP